MAVQLRDKDYEKFKKLSDKHGHKYDSELDMKQSANNLVRLVEVLMEIDMAEKDRKHRLIAEPIGFSLEGKGRNCSLCGQGVYEGDGWYDRWGFKCMNCQDAVNKKKIPGSLCGDYDHKKCITDSALSLKSGMHVQTIRKLIRQDKIKARQIPKGPFMILKKDNPLLAEIIVEEKSRMELQHKERK